MFSYYARRPLPAQRQEQHFEALPRGVRVPRVDRKEEVVDGRVFVAAGAGQRGSGAGTTAGVSASATGSKPRTAGGAGATVGGSTSYRRDN